MRKWMTLFFAVALMLMILASARGEMVSVTELREQVGTMGRWTADYTDRYDRKIHVDIEPIMGQYDAVPIILAENPRQFTEENIKNSIVRESRYKMSRKIIIALIGAAVVMAAGCSKNTQGNVNGGNAMNEASLEE